LMLYFREIRH